MPAPEAPELPAPADTEPKLEEERPTAAPPSREDIDKLLEAAIQASEKGSGPNANPGGTAGAGKANTAGIEGERKTKLDALEASQYGQAKTKEGAPLFTAAELALLAKKADDVPAAKKLLRTNLQKKFSAWKADEKERIEKEHEAKLKAAAEARGRELEVGSVQQLTGREPFQNWNNGIGLGQALRILGPETTELKFAEPEIEAMKADMAQVLLENPELRKWLLLHTAEARLCLALALGFSGKLKRYKAAKEKAA